MCDVGYLCANFSLPRPLCSRVTPDIRDRQRDVRQKHRLMPRLGSRGIIIQENLQWHGGHIRPHDDWQLKVKWNGKTAAAVQSHTSTSLCGRDGRTICGPQRVHHRNSLGGATWRSVTITGRTDRQTDRQSATQYAAPSLRRRAA